MPGLTQGFHCPLMAPCMHATEAPATEQRSEEEAAVEVAVAARLGALGRPPPWIDVTTALRFLTEDGRIVVHKVRSLLAQLASAEEVVP